MLQKSKVVSENPVRIEGGKMSYGVFRKHYAFRKQKLVIQGMNLMTQRERRH